MRKTSILPANKTHSDSLVAVRPMGTYPMAPRVSIAILPQVQSRGVFLIWIIWIMKVLTASLLPSPLGNGDISVSITSMNGEEICRVELPWGTLADLEKILCDPHGPMFGLYPWPCLLFFAENEPTGPLDRKLQMDAFHSLVIKRGLLVVWNMFFISYIGDNHPNSID